MDELVKWAAGNPGAAEFLSRLFLPKNRNAALDIVPRLVAGTSIRGTNLYVLWSDLCGRDMDKVALLCRQCPTEVLEDACSRQDYSGRKLVAPYLSLVADDRSFIGIRPAPIEMVNEDQLPFIYSDEDDVPSPQYTPEELLEKYRDPDEEYDERIEQMARREEENQPDRSDDEPNETHFL